MKKFLTIIVIAMCVFSVLKAQEGDKFGISLTGFVKTDVFYDTRQTMAFREGHFLLYPKPELLDADKNDINEGGNFNILSIQTRLAGNITAPDVLGAKARGYIEGEFFGSSDGDGNGFRLRHAYVDLIWQNTELRVGQFWHPMFITDCFPNTISFNTGAPFQPFSRNPMIRFIQKFGDLKITLAAITQRDFRSQGPNGESTDYLRNAGMPEMYGGLQFNFGQHFIGAGGGYKTLKPKLQSTFTSIQNPKIVKLDETIGSFESEAYMKFIFDPVTIKLEGIYGQNINNLTMLGGYAIKTFDTTTLKEEYTNCNTLSAWGEISTGKEIEIAIFGGYTKNLGSDDVITGAYYGRDANIQSIMRVSPRFVWNLGKVRLALEVEYTSATFGTPDYKDKMESYKDTKTVANIRTLLAAYIFF
jgi:hypothetical protein